MILEILMISFILTIWILTGLIGFGLQYGWSCYEVPLAQIGRKRGYMNALLLNLMTGAFGLFSAFSVFTPRHFQLVKVSDSELLDIVVKAGTYTYDTKEGWIKFFKEVYGIEIE